MSPIALLKQTRQLTLKICSDLDTEAMIKIPDGFNNNLLWNLGHVVVTQQLLCYKLSGLDMLVDTALVDDLKKASSPNEWSAVPDLAQLKELAVSLPEQLEADYNAGKFTNFETYETSAGVTLGSIDDALAFNNFHEGIHVGSMLALKRNL